MVLKQNYWIWVQRSGLYFTDSTLLIILVIRSSYCSLTLGAVPVGSVILNYLMIPNKWEDNNESLLIWKRRPWLIILVDNTTKAKWRKMNTAGSRKWIQWDCLQNRSITSCRCISQCNELQSVTLLLHKYKYCSVLRTCWTITTQ
jgi:hypothetical protein